MFVNFIYYRMLVDVAIFHGIIKGRLLRSLKARHCLHARKDRDAFDVPNFPPLSVHSLSLLFIYLPRYSSPIFIYFSLPTHLRVSCHNRSELMEGSRRNKGPERYMNIY